MKNLGINWITEYTTDIEYKKYLLLAYLNSVEQEYKQSKLFPSFSDVLFHYRNLVSLKEKQEFFKEHLPKKMSGVDFENLQIIYETISLIEDPNENYRLMKTQFIKSYYNRISDTYFSIKSDMLKLKNSIVNPSVFSIQSKISYPFEETILPITKRIFMSKSKIGGL